MKYARLIDQLAKRLGVSTEEAMGVFYHTQTFQMIQQGVADLHCRSDRYLVDELLLELGKLSVA
ncbi:MAG: DUF3791 domain-containing protein [Bacteroidaceae bacterium]|nr:DUF3791 domain-containing protein [Bacteroidaceae bacterium]